MIRRCSWCKKLLGYRCPLCGAELTDSDLHGYKRCQDCLGGSTIHFSIANMATTHTICDTCAKALRRTADAPPHTTTEAPPEKKERTP